MSRLGWSSSTRRIVGIARSLMQEASWPPDTLGRKGGAWPGGGRTDKTSAVGRVGGAGKNSVHGFTPHAVNPNEPSASNCTECTELHRIPQGSAWPCLAPLAVGRRGEPYYFPSAPDSSLCCQQERACWRDSKCAGSRQGWQGEPRPNLLADASGMAEGGCHLSLGS